MKVLKFGLLLFCFLFLSTFVFFALLAFIRSASGYQPPVKSVTALIDEQWGGE